MAEPDFDRRVQSEVSALSRTFDQNAIWFTGLTGAERVLAVLQTMLIANVLGQTEYGVYLFLFTTIGTVASVAALQMGLTATVFVSRYRETDKAKAAGVIATTERFGWFVALAFVALTAPFSQVLAERLLGSAEYGSSIVLASLLVAATIVSGMQDGVAQGFEEFAFLAKVKILLSAVVLGGVYLGVERLGLNGVLIAVIAGLVLKWLILQWAINRDRTKAGIPAAGGGVSFRSLVSNFAFPSMAISLGTGYVTWLGAFILSQQPGGFDGVAVVNTGIQWRSPLLLLASAVGTVAVPAFSRYAESGDHVNAGQLKSRLFMISLLTSVAGSLVVMFGAGQIFDWYRFAPTGHDAFILVVVSAIPTVLTQVYFQQWVGAARMWRILVLHVPYFLIGLWSFSVLVPRYHAFGYAVANLLSAVVLMACVLIGNYVDGRTKGGDVSGRA